MNLQEKMLLRFLKKAAEGVRNLSGRGDDMAVGKAAQRLTTKPENASWAGDDKRSLVQKVGDAASHISRTDHHKVPALLPPEATPPLSARDAPEATPPRAPKVNRSPVETDAIKAAGKKTSTSSALVSSAPTQPSDTMPAGHGHTLRVKRTRAQMDAEDEANRAAFWAQGIKGSVKANTKKSDTAADVAANGITVGRQGPKTDLDWFSTSTNKEFEPGKKTKNVTLLGRSLANAMTVPRVSKRANKYSGAVERSHYLGPKRLGSKGQLQHQADTRRRFMAMKNAEIDAHNNSPGVKAEIDKAAALGPIKSGKNKGKDRVVKAKRERLTSGDYMSATLTTIRKVLNERNWESDPKTFHASRKGMFKKYKGAAGVAKLEARRNRLKGHVHGHAGRVKMAQLNLAIRAKKHHGLRKGA